MGVTTYFWFLAFFSGLHLSWSWTEQKQGGNPSQDVTCLRLTVSQTESAEVTSCDEIWNEVENEPLMETLLVDVADGQNFNRKDANAVKPVKQRMPHFFPRAYTSEGYQKW